MLNEVKAPGADRVRLARDEADRASVWLNKAVAAGYNNLDEMNSDKDLDILRDRADFKKLLAELKTKEEKPKK